MKFARTLAKTAFTITLIACMFSTAAARGMSVEVVEPGAVGIDPVDRLPSLEIARPLEIEIPDRAPSVDMGFYPFDSDPTRKSLIWNAFPEPLQDEFFERTPSLQLAQPLESEVVGKAPSVDMGFYPVDVTAKTPSAAVHQPLQDEFFERMPTQAVREPLDIECCGPTMRFDLKEAASAEIAIYSVNGRLVRRLTEALPSGESSLTWDGRDDRGGRAASGVYFARVQANEETGKGKLVLVH